MPSGYRAIESFEHLTERPNPKARTDEWDGELDHPDLNRRLQATTALLRTVASVALRTLAEAENAGVVEEPIANVRAATITRFALHLSGDERLMAYEQLREALAEVDRVRSDMWDQAEGDREHLEHSADADAENAIRKLVGRRK